MSQNIEIVRRAIEAWNCDDFDAARLLVHPEVELRTPSDLFLDIENVYRGHAAFHKWWKINKEPWEYFKGHIERTLEQGNKVVAVVRFEAVGKATAAKVKLHLTAARVELHFVNAWELEDGLIVKFTAYHSLEEALEAEGMTE